MAPVDLRRQAQSGHRLCNIHDKAGRGPDSWPHASDRRRAPLPTAGAGIALRTDLVSADENLAVLGSYIDLGPRVGRDRAAFDVPDFRLSMLTADRESPAIGGDGTAVRRAFCGKEVQSLAATRTSGRTTRRSPIEGKSGKRAAGRCSHRRPRRAEEWPGTFRVCPSAPTPGHQGVS